MITFNLEAVKGFKKPHVYRTYSLNAIIDQQHTNLKSEVSGRPFTIQVQDSGDIENQTILVSEYHKPPVEVRFTNRRLHTAECSCYSFFFEEINNCIHIEAARRLFRESDIFRNRFSSKERHAPCLVYDSSDRDLSLLGNWSKEQIAEAGIIETDTKTQITDLNLIHQFAINHPEMVSKQITTHYFDRIVKRTNSIIHEEWADNLDVKLPYNKVLYEFQEFGARFLIKKKRCILADDMGLGKTLMSLAATETLFKNEKIKRVLIISPASVKYNWMQEILDNTYSPVTVLHSAKSLKHLETSNSVYFICSYELMQRHVEKFIAMNFDVVIADEAQKVRNFETKTWGAIKQIKSEYFYLLSGTLIENKLQDLFSIMELIDKDIFGPKWKFENTYFKNYGERFAGYHNLKDLRKRISPYILRRLKSAVMKELPAITETTIYCSLSKEQAALENEYRDKAQKLLAISSQRELTFVERAIVNQCLLKARQACDAAELCKPNTLHPGSPKLEEFSKIVEDLCNNPEQKILVFSEWIEMLNLASKKLDALDIEYVVFNGTIAVQKRAVLIEEFINNPKKRVFLSTDAGGVGLNLQAASNVIHLDIPWNPAKLDQRNGRVHRINQKNNCFVIYLVSETGIERGIEGVLKSKRSIRNASLDSETETEEVSFESFTSALNKIIPPPV